MAKIKLVPKAQRGLSTRDISNIKGLNLTTISNPVTTWDIIKGNSKYDPNIYNILIIGGDNVSSSGYRGNSDTLIIVSIDKNVCDFEITLICQCIGSIILINPAIETTFLTHQKLTGDCIE